MYVTRFCTGLSVFLGGAAAEISGQDRLTATAMNANFDGVLVGAGVGAGSETGVGAGFDSRLTEKRYHQLITQMNFYNLDFDPRKFWGYGCNCFHLSDRPMTDGLGLGVVDEIDTACKKYKGNRLDYTRFD